MSPSVDGMTVAEERKCLAAIRADPDLGRHDVLPNGMSVGVFAIHYVLGSARKRQAKRRTPSRSKRATPQTPDADINRTSTPTTTKTCPPSPRSSQT